MLDAKTVRRGLTALELVDDPVQSRVQKKSMGVHPDRNAQFENIGQIKAAYLAKGEPMLSIDTKKKALIGNFARDDQTHASNRHVFKKALQRLVDRLGLAMRIAHYPPYCSKHNPIEHPLFAHVTRACQGVTFQTVQIARQFMAKAQTSTGLKVTAEVLGGFYVKDKKVTSDFLENMRLVFNAHLPRCNYRAVPANG